MAGSGKTTIALHRIAWLLYAHRETLRPEQLMILAPNPLFLDYISQVLPDLGVERVVQTTFQGLCQGLLGKQLPKVRAVTRLEDKLQATPGERAAVGAVLRRKGSLAFKASIEDFVARWQEEMLPQTGWTFGNVILFSQAELKAIFLKQLAPFPLKARMDEMKKYLRRRLRTAADEMKRKLEAMAQERLDTLLARLPDGPERRARATRLLESRDQRLREVDERAAAYLKEYAKLWPDVSLATVYGLYLRRCEAQSVQDATLPYLEKGAGPAGGPARAGYPGPPHLRGETAAHSPCGGGRVSGFLPLSGAAAAGAYRRGVLYPGGGFDAGRPRGGGHPQLQRVDGACVPRGSGPAAAGNQLSQYRGDHDPGLPSGRPPSRGGAAGGPAGAASRGSAPGIPLPG